MPSGNTRSFCWATSDSILLLQHVSLCLFISPHPMTKPTGSSPRQTHLGVCMWWQTERITTWQLSHQGTLPTKRKKKKSNQKKLESNQKQVIIWLWPSSTSIAKKYSHQSNKLQFCTLLCKEIENCPQKTAWKSPSLPVAFFLFPNLGFKNRHMGLSLKLTHFAA